MDNDGLFGDATNNIKRKAEEATSTGKRFKLKRYDHLAAQALKPHGVSNIEMADLKSLWTIIANGNKSVLYFAEWPDTDPWRKGIAISRLAEVMLAVITTLKDPKFAKHLRVSFLLTSAMTEAIKLSPALLVLNAGKGSKTAAKVTITTLGNAKSTPKNKDDVIKAANELYAWLSQKKSTLRALLSFMSQGGVFYAATVAEKAARAYILHGDEDQEAFVNAAVARTCSTEKTEEPDNDQDALFDEPAGDLFSADPKEED